MSVDPNYSDFCIFKTLKKVSNNGFQVGIYSDPFSSFPVLRYVPLVSMEFREYQCWQITFGNTRFTTQSEIPM